MDNNKNYSAPDSEQIIIRFENNILSNGDGTVIGPGDEQVD